MNEYRSRSRYNIYGTGGGVTSPFSSFITGPRKFAGELRRRRVFRVAAVYGGVAFVVGEVANNYFPALNIPDWALNLVLVLMVIGFPIAIGLAWAFDITDEGIVRAKGRSADAERKAQPIVGNKALAVIALVATLVAAWSWFGGGVKTAEIRSIAVLPLKNLMNDPEQDYFVEGMHEALTSELSKLSALRVIGRTSTMSYKDNPKPISVIAEELNVDAVIEGSLFRDGDRVRITVQLVATRPERHLWSNDYERGMAKILVLTKDVARAIAQEIKIVLTPDEETRLAETREVNPEAYDLFLKGWHFRKLLDAPKMLEYLEQAIALDSTFAQGWAALGYALAGRYGIDRPWGITVLVDDGLLMMLQAINKALELDPDQPLAHTHLGLYHEFKWDYVAAEASFKRVLELDPNNAPALYEYGLLLLRTGRPDEALELFQLAMKLDPLDYWPYDGISKYYRDTRQYEKELETRQLYQEIQARPSNDNAIERISLLLHGHYAEVVELAGVNSLVGMRALIAMGNLAAVHAFHDSISATGELQKREQTIPNWSARFYAIMGEREMALNLLEGAYKDSTKEFYYCSDLVYAPEFDFLRAAPRFKNILKEMGLGEVFNQNGQRIR